MEISRDSPFLGSFETVILAFPSRLLNVVFVYLNYHVVCGADLESVFHIFLFGKGIFSLIIEDFEVISFISG